jgi:hypothetical protein
MRPKRAILLAETGGDSRIIRCFCQVFETTDIPAQTDPEDGCLSGTGKRPQPGQLQWEGRAEVATGERMDESVECDILDTAQETERDVPIVGRDHPTRHFDCVKAIVKSHPNRPRERDRREDAI